MLEENDPGTKRLIRSLINGNIIPRKKSIATMVLKNMNSDMINNLKLLKNKGLPLKSNTQEEKNTEKTMMIIGIIGRTAVEVKIVHKEETEEGTCRRNTTSRTSKGTGISHTTTSLEVVAVMTILEAPATIDGKMTIEVVSINKDLLIQAMATKTEERIMTVHHIEVAMIAGMATMTDVAMTIEGRHRSTTRREGLVSRTFKTIPHIKNTNLTKMINRGGTTEIEVAGITGVDVVIIIGGTTVIAIVTVHHQRYTRTIMARNRRTTSPAIRDLQ